MLWIYFIIKIYIQFFFNVVSFLNVESSETNSSESSDPEHTSRLRAKHNKHTTAAISRRKFGNSLPQQHPTSNKEMFSASCK